MVGVVSARYKSCRTDTKDTVVEQYSVFVPDAMLMYIDTVIEIILRTMICSESRYDVMMHRSTYYHVPTQSGIRCKIA